MGEASVMAKLTAGVSTDAACPFTYSLDVGARLYARVQAPSVFGWSGGEYDLTPKWNKGIIAAGTCPDLGPIPSKRDLGLIDAAGEFSAPDRNSYGQGLASESELPGAHIHREVQQRSGHLAKRGSVYGPVLSLPVGKFFCPPSNNPNENESSSCSDVEPAWDQDEYLNEDYESRRRRRRSEDATIVVDDNDDLDDIASEILAHIDKRAIGTKKVRACQNLIAEFSYPTDGSLPAGTPIYGWEEPEVCGSYDWGGPLNARVANTEYHSEHILEAQLVKKFFQYMDENTDLLPNPDPNAPNNEKMIKFCKYVEVMFEIPAVAAPNMDTAQGFAAVLEPMEHIAAQFPTHNWKADEYVSLEGQINTPAKGKGWGTPREIIKTEKWLTHKLRTATGAREMLKAMRSLIGSRIYHNDGTVMTILRAQKNRVGAILGLLDTTILPANPPPGLAAWRALGLQDEWNKFMRSEFLLMQTKTMKVLHGFIGPLMEHWANDAVKQANQDQQGDSGTVLTQKQQIRNLIDDIEAMNDYLRTMPAWQWPF